MILYGEKWEVCDLVEAEVDLFQAAQTNQCSSLHLCDLIIKEKELLQPPQPLKVVLLHHLQFVGGQVKVPEPRCILKHSKTQGAELIVRYPEVFQSGHSVETAWIQPGQMVVAEVEGDREGWQ